MCGRYTLATSYEQLVEEFELGEFAMPTPRFNIAPTQMVPVVRLHEIGGTFDRRLNQLHWGLIPHWAKDPGIGSRMINARSEEAASKPAFRVPLRRQRCLVPATGFYEWRALAGGSASRPKKQPYCIRRRDERPMAFGGLWERWDNAEGDTIESFAILTTSPNEMMRPLHDRMPVIIHRSDYEIWLDPKMRDTDRLRPLFDPFPNDELTAYPVSTCVNSVKFDDPACIEAAM